MSGAYRLLCLVPLLATSATLTAQSAPAANAHRAAGRESALVQTQRARDLLLRSHGLNDQVDQETRIGLLHEQIHIAYRVDKDLGREWAKELLDMGTSQHNRWAVGMALNSIAAFDDSQEAMKLLDQMESWAVEAQPAEFPGADVVSSNIQMAFVGLVGQKGKAAVPDVLEAADRLGAKGRYPYSAVMAAMAEAKDERLIRGAALKVLARMQQGIDGPTAGFDFGLMLQQSKKIWPKDLLKPAVEAAVQGILRYPVNDENKGYELTISTEDGSSTARGPVEIGLLRIAPLLNQVDVELWAATIQKFPGIARYASVPTLPKTQTETFRLSGDDQKEYGGDPTERALMKIQALVWQNPDKAEQTMASITDPALRARAYSMAAQNWAEGDPSRASRASAAAQKATREIKDPKLLFPAACARLQSDAASGDNSQLSADLDDAFALADKLLKAAHEEKDHYERAIIASLANAVNAAVKIEPDLTIAHLEMIAFPYERASLYVAAASGLAAKPKVPPARTEQSAGAK